MTDAIFNDEVMLAGMSKLCKRCSSVKPRSMFYKKSSARDGLQLYCKNCLEEMRRLDRSNNPEKYINRERARWSSNKAAEQERFRGWYEKNKASEAEKSRQWNSENKERVAARDAKKYAENSEKIRARSNDWRSKNRHAARESSIRWQKNNPERARVNVAKRRAVSRKAMPEWTIRFFMEEAYSLARLRTKATGFKWHVDHIVPMSADVVCGLHSHTNLAVIPAVENLKKQNHHWPDMP